MVFVGVGGVCLHAMLGAAVSALCDSADERRTMTNDSARKDEIAETSLGRALRRIAKGTRLTSLDVPILEDAADELDRAKAALTSYEEERTPSGEGWQPPPGPEIAELCTALRDRIGTIERCSDGGNKGVQCVECGEWSGEHHDHCQVVFYRDLLAVLDSLPPPKGQHAKDATPPASGGEGAT